MPRDSRLPTDCRAFGRYVARKLRVYLHDAHAGRDQLAQAGAGVVGDLLGSQARVLGGFGQHLDLERRKLGVNVERSL